MAEIYGKPHAYFETGTEGVYWAVIEDNVSGYEGLHILENGDHLTIYSNNVEGQALFSDFINKDTVTGLQPRPFNPDFKQQVALGMWVHWIQEGYDPDKWAEFFINENLRVKLLRARR